MADSFGSVFCYGVGQLVLTSRSFFKAPQRAESRRVSLLASEKSNSVKLIFSKSNIDIVANTPEVGEAKESLSVMYKGREFSIAFNPEFLMAPLRNLSEDEIYLDLIDEMSPGVIKIAGPFLYVLMPVRLS